MKIDFILNPVGARYAEMRAAALAAEEAGFDGLWTWDHLRDPDEQAEAGVPEAWTTLTALAEATHRLTLGPLVLNTGLRHPGLLANMAATLQQVSGGRLLLGLVAGATRSMAYAREHEALGMEVAPDRVRAERVAETAQVLRRLWTGDASNFAGAQFRLDRPSGYLRPDPPPPIIIAGFGPRMAGIAGRHGDGFNTQAMHPDLAELARVAREAHAASGRDPARFSVSVFAGLSERWLRAGTPERVRLERVGVDRLILLASPPYDLGSIRLR
jgi:alkanesulfonate monooxygenase SsuD/methylene tetrahydromethanopterin reductase-like flavin-dependent oxidoreductase (luciferase family)